MTLLAPLFVGPMGPLEIGVILLLIVLLFGANKIPELAGSVGEAKKEFEKAQIKADQELEEYQEEIESDKTTENDVNDVKGSET
ncbi:MAG: twin-arginine translocase TatA/TatE family subunit [Halobacteria archaeon]